MFITGAFTLLPRFKKKLVGREERAQGAMMNILSTLFFYGMKDLVGRVVGTLVSQSPDMRAALAG